MPRFVQALMVLAFAYSGRYNTRPIVNVSTQLRHGRAWVEVNLANLLANARAVQRAAGGSPLLPMVKASAYGLGAVRVARALETLDPWGFGVATVEKGVELREAGISRPLVVFTPAAADQQEAYAAHDLVAVIDDPEVAAGWKLPYHIEIDTGMGRCGLRYDDARLAAVATARLEGAFTHFASADTQPETVDWQLSRFESAVERIGKSGILLHAANSAGAWRLARRLDLARPGIFLYGGRCGPDLPRPHPVVSVKARVVSLRRLPRGEPVSYGGEWRAPRETTVATVGIGYADGFPWTARGKAAVLVTGRRYPVVGRVTMDFIMIDLGSPPSAVRVGDIVTVIGEDGGEAISLDELAQWSGTISYEILTRLGDRLQREYVGG
ncbi:MAG: alanine racemase [Gemmatimonadota bacterium]|nr:MAG: alanine racemase [Gemmatimonadota bacterium]